MATDADNIISLYEEYAEVWDKDRGCNLFEKPWLDRWLALMPPGGSVLDVGCGSGEPIAHYVIEKGYRVTGIDSSLAMIRMCKERLPAQDWIVADMRKLSLNRSFGGILAWDSFFHLCPEDQRRMFPIFGQHAAPGAPLMFTSGPSLGEAIGVYRGKPLYHGSLDGAEYRLLLNANGFDVLSHVIEDTDCGSHTIWLAQRR